MTNTPFSQEFTRLVVVAHKAAQEVVDGLGGLLGPADQLTVSVTGMGLLINGPGGFSFPLPVNDKVVDYAFPKGFVGSPPMSDDSLRAFTDLLMNGVQPAEKPDQTKPGDTFLSAEDKRWWPEGKPVPGAVTMTAEEAAENPLVIVINPPTEHIERPVATPEPPAAPTPPTAPVDTDAAPWETVVVPDEEPEPPHAPPAEPAAEDPPFEPELEVWWGGRETRTGAWFVYRYERKPKRKTVKTIQLGNFPDREVAEAVVNDDRIANLTGGVIENKPVELVEYTR